LDWRAAALGSNEQPVKPNRSREPCGERAVQLEVQRMRPDALGDDFPDLGAKPLGFRLEGGGLREFEGQPVSLARDRRERKAEPACCVVHNCYASGEAAKWEGGGQIEMAVRSRTARDFRRQNMPNCQSAM